MVNPSPQPPADALAAVPTPISAPGPTDLPPSSSRDEARDAQPRAKPTEPADPTAAVPLVDDQGQPVLKSDGSPMLRPVGLDPHFFVEEGTRDRQIIDDIMAYGGESAFPAPLAYLRDKLANFGRGAPWDAQRIGGRIRPEFVDYATVAIGLYAAAVGLSREEILAIEDYVARDSHYAPKTKFDATHPHLPNSNVENTDLGYKLYRSGAIGTKPNH